MLYLVESPNKANIFLGLIEYELNSLLGALTIYQFIFDSTLKDICQLLLYYFVPLLNGMDHTNVSKEYQVVDDPVMTGIRLVEMILTVPETGQRIINGPDKETVPNRHILQNAQSLWVWERVV